MSCADGEHGLQERLDGAGGDRPDLEPHLATCPTCRERHAAARRLEEGLRLLAPPAPPAGLTGRIASRVLADRRARLRRRRLLLPGAAAAAAAAVLLVYFLASREHPSPPEPVAPMVVEYHPESPPSASLRDSVVEASSAVVDLTRRTADETVGESRLLVPVVVTRPPDAGGGPMPAVQPLREAGQGVSTGLDPVTDSARRALDLFLQDIPPMGLDTKQGS
jgi:hypothetical protein